MKLIDLSQPLYDGSPNCPVHPPVRSVLLKDHPQSGWRVEHLSLSNHTGSHVDAPLHKIAGGASLDELSLERFRGPALIADVRGLPPGAPITVELLQSKLRHPLPGMIVLLATGWGQKRAHTHEWLYDSPYLSPEAARWLVENGVNGVGIDHYSVAFAIQSTRSFTRSSLATTCGSSRNCAFRMRHLPYRNPVNSGHCRST